MLDPSIIDAMIASGCTVEQLGAVIKAHLLAENEKILERRYRATIIKRNQRSRPPDSTGLHRTPPDTHIYIDKPMYVEEKVLSVKKESKKVRKKELLYIPENWCPPDRAIVIAGELGLDIQDMEARWRDYLKSSGKLYADHDAAFCNFLRNDRKFNPNKNNISAKPLSPHLQNIHNNNRIRDETRDALLDGTITIQSGNPFDQGFPKVSRELDASVSGVIPGHSGNGTNNRISGSNIRHIHGIPRSGSG